MQVAFGAAEQDVDLGKGWDRWGGGVGAGAVGVGAIVGVGVATVGPIAEAVGVGIRVAVVGGSSPPMMPAWLSATINAVIAAMSAVRTFMKSGTADTNAWNHSQADFGGAVSSGPLVCAAADWAAGAGVKGA